MNETMINEYGLKLIHKEISKRKNLESIINKIEQSINLGILSGTTISILPYITNTQIEDIKQIIYRLTIASGSFIANSLLFKHIKNERSRKVFKYIINKYIMGKRKRNNTSFSPKGLIESAYKDIKEKDYNRVIEDMSVLVSLINNDRNARKSLQYLANDLSLSFITSMKSLNKEKRELTRFLYDIMKGEDIKRAYNEYNLKNYDKYNLLRLQIDIYNEDYKSASETFEEILSNDDGIILNTIQGSKNKVYELRFKDYNVSSFIIKEVNNNVLKEYEIEKEIIVNNRSKSTPIPIGIFKMNDKEYFIEERLLGKPFDSVFESFKRKRDRKLFFKTLDTFLKQNYILTEKKNVSNLSKIVRKIDYEETIVESFKKANKDSLEILLDRMYPAIKHLNENSDYFNHGDLHPGNIVVHNDEPYIIDFEKAMFSTKYFDYNFFIGQPIFNLKVDDEKEIIDSYDLYKVNDSALFYSTGFFVNLIITTRSSKWYQKNKDNKYRNMERFFLSKTLEYLKRIPLNMKKEKIEKILVDEFIE